MTESRVRALRLWAGVVLFVYVAAHLANHAAMLASLAAAEALAHPIFALVRSPPGSLLLYGALALHAFLGLRAIAARESWKAIRPGEIAQLMLGLTIVPLMAGHVTVVRGGYENFGFLPFHTALVANAALRPEIAFDLALGLSVVWLHGCLGVHYWLRFKPFYARRQPVLLALAVLLPVLALLGLLSGLREAGQMLADPAFRDGFAAEYRVPRGEAYAALVTTVERIERVWWFAVALAAAASLLRGWRKRRREGIAVTYPDGRNVRASMGMSLLGASRANGVPHASVCGGRGRCSTCRVRVVAGAAALTPADAAERKVLARVGADPDGAGGTAIVRLACQARLTGAGAVAMVPLLPAHATAATARAGEAQSQGRELDIVVLFADLRGFTGLSSGQLPYDTVFMLNRYFAAMGRAIESKGGTIDKFIGDGVMALFGVDGRTPRDAARQALDAARAMGEALAALNLDLAHDLKAPLRIGIGLHAGPAIVGEMGYGRAMHLTAIGDTVNAASRIEGLSKDFAAELVVAESVFARAEIAPGAAPKEVDLRGREGQVKVYAFAKAGDVAAT
ncbi:MAG: adenylate/guanylate cyclase domain-containing protein [Tagaea sp.]|nr:adenylate/guanylate cyclase domain-containing protein [Tagaea sp.]